MSEYQITIDDTVGVMSRNPVLGPRAAGQLRTKLVRWLAGLPSENDAYQFADVAAVLRVNAQPTTKQMVELSNLRHSRLRGEEPPRDGISRAPLMENYK